MNNKKIIDLDLNFDKHPISGDVSIKSESNAIKQSLKNLLLFSSLEKPFNVQLDTNIKSYLFINFNIIYADSLKEQITNLIKTYETRVKINNVNVGYAEEQNSLDISIDFSIVGNEKESDTLNIIIERER